jgi:DNA (cytosine-5)-methyltransferase 1
MCRLQTMPDNVRVQGGLISAQRQIGNAVPSLLGEVFGQAIRTQLLDGTDKTELSRMPKRAGSTPKAEKPAKVPAKYRDREGEHEAHPGTGLGRGALARESA